MPTLKFTIILLEIPEHIVGVASNVLVTIKQKSVEIASSHTT
jgi:hypothetical protein